MNIKFNTRMLALILESNIYNKDDKHILLI